MTTHAEIARPAERQREERGDDLLVTIRIAADGRLFFHDIPPGLVEVALALAPADPVLSERARAGEILKRIDA